jgi:copper chaperone CopZ
MDTIKFKTNIKCSGCLSKVTPVLNEKVGEGNWDIDLFTLKKTLTVHTKEGEASIISAVKNAGFTAERIT